MSATTTTSRHTGGHLVADTLHALGAEVAFGVPGIHALAVWEAFRTSPLTAIGTRTELCAGFAADGYARSTGRPAPLLLSTGPGALNSLTALMEAASAHVPVVAISSQIPLELLGRGRGYLHELHDQLASFAPIVKHAARVASAAGLSEVLAQAWEIAATPPTGPVYVEIPVDVLIGHAPDATAATAPRQQVIYAAAPGAITQAAELLASAEHPVIWAGGGVIRSGARHELQQLAQLLGAPVATTYMGKGAIGDEHPLAAGCGCDEAALQELLAGADVLLCVGTELGAETTGQYQLKPAGRIIHIDAAPERIGVTYPALALVGDAKATLATLIEQTAPNRRSGAGEQLKQMHDRIRRGLEAQGRELELGLLATIEDALAPDAITTWDMTILAYWAAPHLRLRAGQQFLYPLGSGTLGYAWPAAIGASVASPLRTTLAVAGDGGIHYALGELATAQQYGTQAKLLLVDDGGYGILREYQRDAFGTTTSVDLAQPDFTALAGAFGVAARTCHPDDLAEALRWAFSVEGPAVVVLKTHIVAAAPTS